MHSETLPQWNGKNSNAALLCGAASYLSLGSNVGDRVKTIERAARELDALGEIQLCRLSGFYHTEPVGMESEAWFINCAAQITTTLSPLELLDRLEELESSMGRKNKGHREDRTLDIDILLYDDMIVSFPRLVIPHREMANRRFVLEPLREIAPDIIHPLLRKTTGQLFELLESRAAVSRSDS
ncbi:MAG: 2-amino-4-hydroxy-6-hydroxymethyldihydropteridine diphosphokinase [Nitrospinota bacterium]